MFPELSARCISWILGGANVIKGVFQILEIQKIPFAGDDRYRFLLSDGVTAYPCVMLATRLNHMVVNKELEKFTIVQVNQYVCDQEGTDLKVIILLNLTVLAPGNKVNRKLGNPVISYSSESSNTAITNLPAASGVAESSFSDYDTETGPDPALITYLQLTPGAISGILNEEDVENVVVQIIGLKRTLEARNYCYRLAIFDGVSGWPFVMLGTQLNYMVANKELEKLTVVQVDEYEYKQMTSGPKMIILLKVTVLFSGNEVYEKFVNQNSSSACSQATTNESAVNGVAKQNAQSTCHSSMIEGYARPVVFNQFLYTMFPEVASGAIKRILNGEDVANAVIQILGCEKLPGAGKDRYRLLISDGTTSYTYGFLGTHLNRMFANKELETFTIVRVEKYECNHIVGPDVKVIILLNLTVLVPGNEVNKKLGNPVLLSNSSAATESNTNAEATGSNTNAAATGSNTNAAATGSNTNAAATGSNTNAAAVNGVFETGYSNENAVATHESSKMNESALSVPFTQSCNMFPQLTTGAINRILNGEDVANAIIQMLGCKKIQGAGNDRYRLLISDGVTGCPFAMLGTQLNHMVANKELEKFTIVRVDKCVCNQVQADRKVIILLNLTVLVPGNEVNEKLGNPVNSASGAAATGSSTNAAATGSNTNAAAVNGVFETGYLNENAVAAHESSKMNESALSVPFTQLCISHPQLSTGAITRILNEEDVANAVVQILGCRKIPGAATDRYRLLISDGVTGYSFAMLGTQLNHMVTNEELQKFTIVRVDKYVCNQVQADRKVIILLKITVLVPGNEVNEKLGNPV